MNTVWYINKNGDNVNFNMALNARYQCWMKGEWMGIAWHDMALAYLINVSMDFHSFVHIDWINIMECRAHIWMCYSKNIARITSSCLDTFMFHIYINHILIDFPHLIRNISQWENFSHLAWEFSAKTPSFFKYVSRNEMHSSKTFDISWTGGVYVI